VTDSELGERLRNNLMAFKQFQTDHGALRSLALPGLKAFAQPRHPSTLPQQQVFFEQDAALEAALPQLEDFYRSHGIRLWRVLAPPGSTVEQAVGRAGYRLEGAIPAMGLSLVDTALEPPAIPLDQLQGQEELVPLNAEAFGPGSSIELQTWHAQRFPHVHVRGLREDGALISGGLAHDVEDTAGIYLVATASTARSRGLATEVMRGLLLDARARGRSAAVLQATPLGYGVYRRLGFRDLGGWAQWVRRLG
jgi:ribosomal protein S18 acetylase RimI-like enzyme